jgi:hypothetical protein
MTHPARPPDFPLTLTNSEEIADHIEACSTEYVDIEYIAEAFAGYGAVLRYVSMNEISSGYAENNISDPDKIASYGSLPLETMPPIVLENGVVQDGNHRHQVALSRGAAGMWAYVTIEEELVPSVCSDDSLAHSGDEPASTREIAILSNTMKQFRDSDEFANWFADSRACLRPGRPLTLYRGISRQHEERHPSSHLGIFLSPDPEVAQSYAGAEGAVLELYARIAKPFYMKTEDLILLDDPAAASQMRKSLIEQGYDGILTIPIEGSGAHPGKICEYVVFGAEQLTFRDGRKFDSEPEGAQNTVRHRPRL